jgi:PKD repeat protein
MSRYPDSLDADDNLYLVHDSLRLQLADDYNPGDQTITVNPDVIFNSFPPSGIITLTEQCSDIALRAISLSYSSKGTNTFNGLVLMPGFTDVAKPKRITDVTLSVMAEHHNTIKDAVIAIESFAGVQGEIALTPLSGTMEARINYLRQLVLQPRAWFTVDRKIGIVPLCVNFKDFSTRSPDTWVWNFGDGNQTTISGSTTGDVSHCYYTPGVYNVTLTATNQFGSNQITLSQCITARVAAPDVATIDFVPTTQQTYINGVLRSRINRLISILIDSSGQQPLDPVVSYTWLLGDDLTHGNSDQTQASYGIGGLYDAKVTAETSLGAYRTTVATGAIDIIEKLNIWHMIFDPAASATATTKNLYVYEFGLLSETYKAASSSSILSVTRDAGFLTGAANYDQQYREFRRNNGFAPRTLTTSGDGGSASVFWAEGAPTSSIQQLIRFREWNGFSNSWSTPVLGGTDNIERQWNWLALVSESDLYITFGSPGPGAFSGSPTNQSFVDVDLSNYSLSNINFSSGNYLNGAQELMQNVGGPSSGNFSVYRGTWQNSTGYFLRNDGVGDFFRLKSFYATEGTTSLPLQGIRKLTDIPGTTKLEGQLVALSGGLYFFNNSGEVVVYRPDSNSWEVGGPGANSPVFGKLQDTSVVGYDDPANTLIATSDQSTNAYLFFDYSVRAQIKFNETDMTFTTLPVRPSGEQFLAGLY